ncbi:hypothetical protein CCAX7_18400 [Capsulimonas corticalis]|uniref:Uncharacterized protein n=1 Tax=Capsulimonas corticalis TaxID=2219043 RepID=A0A402D5F1_9BACT|nr:hypothetical protein [Capsulimonas corticalis]BDI29789.1 hypothetical protein CCAX7_18400 [Capsulimonas corticalis]
MEVRPQDLDAAHRDKLLRMRSGAEQREDVTVPEFLKKDRKRRERRGFRFFPFMFLGLFAFHGGHDLLQWSWLLFFLLPLAFMRGRGAVARVIDSNAPITVQEADTIGVGQDTLEANYGILLRSVIEAQGLSASAQRNIHEALRGIGDLVENLSIAPGLGGSSSADAIQRQANETEEKARLETDPVVAASLRRQAETLRGSAALASQRTTLRRRREAARGEVLTQIQAMQVSLESHTLSDQNESGDFALLSANIQQISAEVNAALNAREEVRSIITPLESPSNVQRLGQ